jgi:hypothetical protein
MTKRHSTYLFSTSNSYTACYCSLKLKRYSEIQTNSWLARNCSSQLVERSSKLKMPLLLLYSSPSHGLIKISFKRDISFRRAAPRKLTRHFMTSPRFPSPSVLLFESWRDGEKSKKPPAHRTGETYCVITLKDPLTKATAECVSFEITQRLSRKMGKRCQGSRENCIFCERKFVFPDVFSFLSPSFDCYLILSSSQMIILSISNASLLAFFTNKY